MKKCSGCGVLKSKTEYQKNKSRADGLQHYCKDCKKSLDKKSNQKHKDKVRERKRRYRINRKAVDPLYRAKCNMRRRIHKAFKAKRWNKNSKTAEIIGEDITVVKTFIEVQFTEGMTWDNYGEWHIDHIIPLASATTEEELIKLCHYTNLQPLWQEDNLKKGDKIL